MEDIIVSSFLSMLQAIGRIFIVIIGAGILVRKNVITQEQIKSLSQVTVLVLLPALIFSNTIINFQPTEFPGWWVIPFAGIFMSLLGVGSAALLLLGELRKERNMLPLAGMQNAGYLVLPIGKILYPDNFEQFALYVFLFLLGYNPLLWSLGKVLTTSDGADMKLNIRDLLTPPVAAMLASIIIVLLDIQFLIPKMVLDSVHLIGEATVPVATFILGATLGGISLKIWPKWSHVLKISVSKYIVVPAATMAILYYFRIYVNRPLLADFFVIQASAAPATAIILQVRTYGGNVQRIGSMMIISYAISLLAMPLIISIWKYLTVSS